MITATEVDEATEMTLVGLILYAIGWVTIESASDDEWWYWSHASWWDRVSRKLLHPMNPGPYPLPVYASDYPAFLDAVAAMGLTASGLAKVTEEPAVTTMRRIVNYYRTLTAT